MNWRMAWGCRSCDAGVDVGLARQPNARSRSAHRRAHSRGRRFVAASGVGAVILSGVEGDDSSFSSNVGNLLQGGRGAGPPNGNEGTDLPYGAPIPVLRHMRRYAHCARSAASVDTPMNQRNSMFQVVCSINWRSDRTEWNA